MIEGEESVSVVVRKSEGAKSRFFLIKQPGGKPQPYTWFPPSGGVKPGETPEAACVREVKEETGLDVKVLKRIFTMPAEFKARFVHFYLADCVGGDVKLDPSEALSGGWFTVEEALGLDLVKGTRLLFEKYEKELVETVKMKGSTSPESR